MLVLFSWIPWITEWQWLKSLTIFEEAILMLWNFCVPTLFLSASSNESKTDVASCRHWSSCAWYHSLTMCISSPNFCGWFNVLICCRSLTQAEMMSVLYYLTVDFSTCRHIGKVFCFTYFVIRRVFFDAWHKWIDDYTTCLQITVQNKSWLIYNKSKKSSETYMQIYKMTDSS